MLVRGAEPTLSVPWLNDMFSGVTNCFTWPLTHFAWTQIYKCQWRHTNAPRSFYVKFILGLKESSLAVAPVVLFHNIKVAFSFYPQTDPQAEHSIAECWYENDNSHAVECCNLLCMYHHIVLNGNVWIWQCGLTPRLRFHGHENLRTTRKLASRVTLVCQGCSCWRDRLGLSLLSVILGGDQLL